MSCYKKEGFDFLLKTFNTPNFLEDLTGLSKLFSETLDDKVYHMVYVNIKNVASKHSIHCNMGPTVF